MALPIIPDVFQVTLNWNNPNAPRDASTVLHFRDTVGTQTENNLSVDLAAAVTSAMWTNVENNGRVSALRITKLDGTSAGVDYTIAAAAKWTGSGVGGLIPQGAQVISLKSAQRGPRGRNRIYLPWIAESESTNGTLTAANVATMTSAWATFVTSMQTSGWQLVAVSAQYAQAYDVLSPVARPYLATQRRRARR